MSCGIPQFFSLLWSIRDTVRGDSLDDGLSAARTNTATTTTTTRHTRSNTGDTGGRIRGQSQGQEQSQDQDHDCSQTGFENTSQTTQTTTARSELSNEKDADSNNCLSAPAPSIVHPPATMSTTNSASPSSSENNAYATLLTRPSYLPGVVILAHTLKKQNSKYPLVVLVTPGLPQECVEVVQNVGKGLKFEDGTERVVIWRVDLLLPEKWQLPESLIAARFEVSERDDRGV